jgi:hypothetical protein
MVRREIACSYFSYNPEYFHVQELKSTRSFGVRVYEVPCEKKRGRMVLWILADKSNRRRIQANN